MKKGDRVKNAYRKDAIPGFRDMRGTVVSTRRNRHGILVVEVQWDMDKGYGTSMEIGVEKA